MTNLAATFLVLGMLAIMATRAIPVIRAPMAGKSELDLPVPMLFRFLVHRTNVICILAVLVLGSGLIGERWIPHGLFVLALVAMAGMICVPVRYRFTSVGVSPNSAVFRPWSDFDRWEAQGNAVVLKGHGRFGSLKLYVANNDRDQVLNVLRRHLKGKR